MSYQILWGDNRGEGVVAPWLRLASQSGFISMDGTMATTWYRHISTTVSAPAIGEWFTYKYTFERTTRRMKLWINGNLAIDIIWANNMQADTKVAKLFCNYYVSGSTRSHTWMKVSTDGDVDAHYIFTDEEPGALAKVAKRFQDANINLRNLHIIRRCKNVNHVSLVSDNNKEAMNLVEDIRIK